MNLNMNMNTSSPGVREPLYPHQEDRRRTEDEEEMDIIITKIQEDQTYRSSSRLDIRGVLPCLITMLVLIIVVLTVFPYVFSYVFRLMERASQLQEWRLQQQEAKLLELEEDQNFNTTEPVP